MTEQPTNTLDRLAWAPQMKLRDGLIGEYRGPCPVTGKHRVYVKGGISWDRNGPIGTTYLLDDAGFAHPKHVERPIDAIGPA